MALEIERKFLLKALPVRPPDDILSIDQYYWKNKHGIWERARTYHSDTTGDRYIHTIKKTVNKFVNMETEKDLSKEEFDAFTKVCLSESTSKFINKKRYIHKYGYEFLDAVKK